MKNIHLLILLAVCIFQPLVSLCQGTKLQKPFEYIVKSDIFLFSKKAPFWSRANQYGTIPTAKNIAYSNQISVKKNYQYDSSGLFTHLLGWGAGVNPIFNVDTNSKLLLPEGFLKIRLGSFEVWGGRRKELYGLVGDSLLSSGSYSWSSNAFPIPKIQFNTIGFIPISWSRSLLSFTTSFSHGWLKDMPVVYGSQNIKNVKGYLHQKSFYLKIGKPHWKINMIGGFNHQAQWGGEDQIWPNGLPPKEAWWAVVIGKPWEGSRVGNHLGTLDVGLNWRLKENKALFFYRQNIYDDGSLYTFLNIKDGLQGVSFSNRSTQNFAQSITLQKIVLEWLNTTNQGGDIFDFVMGVFGRDNYFNHYVYSQGWSYKGQIIGTPFIPAQADVKSSLKPIKNMITNNNRVRMIHLAAAGWLDDWQWIVKTSFSVNYGLYDYPYPRRQNQLSSLIQFQKELGWLRGIDWSTSLAFDVGTLYDPSLGLQIGLRKRGFF